MNLVGLHYRVQLAAEPKKTYDLTLGVLGGTSEGGDWVGREWFIYGNESITEIPAEKPVETKK